MRRALDIARGVIHQPQILFLDEPTIGLDLPNRRAIWRHIARLRTQLGVTVFLTTHYLEEANDCDEVAFLSAGRLVRAGRPGALIEQLGKRIIEVETDQPAELAARLMPRLGEALIEGDRVHFRCEADSVDLAALQTELASSAQAVRWRRPNLNDVFLWVNRPFGPVPESSVTMTARPMLAVLEREVLKLLRQRGRLLSTLVRPLLWLLVIGAGFEAVQGSSGVPGYRTFLVPGVLGMTLLFGSMLAALSTVYDKESGVMRMLVIAPLEHYWIALAKALGATLSALIQALMLLVVLGLLGLVSAELSIPLLAAGLLGRRSPARASGCWSRRGRARSTTTPPIMNLVIFPVFFLSGSLYPVQQLPTALRLVATLNPYTYGVDLLKHASIAGPSVVSAADFGVGLDLAVLSGFSVAALAIASIRFSRDAAHEPLVHRLAARQG